MLKCLFLRRKLYDYLENSLSDIDRIKVKKHLDVCNNCQDSLSQLKIIIALAAEKKAPQPDNEFWHNFRVDLDRKLNERLVPPINIERKLSYRLRPLFAYVGALIFILVIGIGSYVYKKPFANLTRIAQDKDLIDEILTLYDLEGSDLELNDNGNLEMDLEEIILSYKFNPIQRQKRG
jgi:hypothetical protein